MDCDTPLVSVVVPTFDRAHLIVEALESVYSQSYRPIELVVVDDGSKDHTCDVVERWMAGHRDDFFFARLLKQENRGGNPARNYGIREARGEFVAFLDSDDRWHAGKLQKQMEFVRADELVGAVYCGLQSWFAEENRVVVPSPRDYPSGRILNQMLIHDVTAPTSCYLVRRSVFDQVGLFDEELQARQDWDMWLRIAAAFKIVAVPEVLVDYREHSGVRTASNPQKEIQAYRMIMQKYATVRRGCSFKVRQAARASFYRRMGRVHFHQKISRPKAFVYQLLAILNWPLAFDSYAALFGMLLPRNGRQMIHRAWNRGFGGTSLAIRSH